MVVIWGCCWRSGGGGAGIAEQGARGHSNATCSGARRDSSPNIAASAHSNTGGPTLSGHNRFDQSLEACVSKLGAPDLGIPLGAWTG